MKLTDDVKKGFIRSLKMYLMIAIIALLSGYFKMNLYAH